MTSSTSEPGLRARLEVEARALGFGAVGVCGADAAPEAGARLRAWLEAGCHGSMIWMAARAGERAAPVALWPAVRSVVMLGMSYAPEGDPLRWHGDGERGVVSVYAQGSDYHDVVKRRLKALTRWLLAAVPDAGVKVFVDTAPVMEKPLAAAAGLGWQGKHSNLVSREHGSWLFLGALMTTVELECDPAAVDRCGSCARCMAACPTDAFVAPYVLDARRCISYLTIEHRGPIPEALRAGVGNRVYGCDDCLAVCPWNKFAETGRELAFAARPGMDGPWLAELLVLDDAGFRARFAGSPVKRVGRGRLVRNACVAAGNSGRGDLYGASLGRLCSDGDAVVAEAAGWALGRVG